MRARRWTYVMAAAAGAYMLLMMWQALVFLRSGRPAAALLGLSVMVLPLLGIYLVWRELNFAGRAQQLADRLAADGQLPPDLPRTPGGRVQPEAAADEFVAATAEVAADPRSPAAWFRMSLAYDAGRDRPRARAAMRYAVALEEGKAPAELPARLRPPEGA